MFVCRWASFRLMFDDIDSNIRKLLERDQDVKYHEHIEGGHYVSVTTGFRCVDFRRWFLPHDQQDQKPTKKGVALRLEEWAKMRNIVETIDDNHPSLASAIPCYLQEDHQNQMGALECPECHPFPNLLSM